MLLRPARLAALLLVLVLGAACRTAAPVAAPESAVPETRVGFVTVSDTVAADAEVAALVAPYRARLAGEMAEVIGRAAVRMEKGGAESLLGNFAADAMLAASARLPGGPADIAVTNNGGLRVPVAEGPITVERMYELMPFDNYLVVVTLTGVGVDSLAQQLARAGGEPVAGLRFTLVEPTETAVDVTVGGRPVDPEASYRVVTSNYLAAGGGYMPALWTPAAREDFDVFLRDVFIAYVRAEGVVEPVLEGRITVVDRAPEPR